MATIVKAEVGGGRARIEQQMLALVRELLIELGSHHAAQNVALESSLDRDLGLGSLERVELLVRSENLFRCRLPDDVAQRVETPAGWVEALLAGKREPAARTRYRSRRPTQEAPPPPVAARGFAEVLRGHADARPERVHIHLLEEENGRDISYGHLFAAASEVAAGLAASGLRRNETVAIMLPTCADFFSAFFGVMLAGGIAVPIYPPARANQIEEYVRRQVLILRNAEVRFLISFEQVRAVAQVMRVSLPSLMDVMTVAALAERGRGSPHVDTQPSDTFFIQYTSGSTGNPKGVTLTHGNVLANVRGIGWAVKANPADVVVSWLPLYHDMGLIGSWLFSLYHGFPITIMSPLAFLSRPERWLWALSDSGGTLCPAPNFSYELCARKISDDAMQGVDLSAWRVAINAGEPVLADTLERFAQRFEPYGFRPESYVPCYGLAESSVALAFPPVNRRPVIDRIRRDTFWAEGRAVPANQEEPDVLRFVANGRALPEHEIRIIDEAGHDVPERVQGKLLFRGPSRTAGYYRNPEATAAAINDDGWLDTGDLAYWANGEIFVTGRKKESIIKAGHNIIPQDVEAAAAEVEGVRRGCVAAFGTIDEETGTERLVIVAETRTSDPQELARIESEIIKSVDARVGMPPDRVELVPSQTVPKTSSGKIRRTETRQLYEKGALKGTKRPPWMQFARLGAGSLGPWLKLGWRQTGRGLRWAYVEALTFGIGLSFGFLARLTPSRRIAARIAGLASRLILGLRGDPVEVKPGAPPLGGEPAVLVANRAAKQDLVTLAAGLAVCPLVADSALLESLPTGLAFLFDPLLLPPVEGEDAPPGGNLEQRIEQAVSQGFSVALFAENPVGTPVNRSRFRLEPFEVARNLSAPIYPVRLESSPNLPVGTSGRAHGARIELGQPLRPNGQESAAALRRRFREALRQLGNGNGNSNG